MSVEIILNKNDFLRIWIHSIRYIFQNIRKVNRISRFGNNRFALARKGFKYHENICYTIPLIFVIYKLRFTGFGRQPGFLDKLLVCFVKADNRQERVIRTLVYVKYIFHFRYKFAVCFGNAPLF